VYVFDELGCDEPGVQHIRGHAGAINSAISTNLDNFICLRLTTQFHVMRTYCN
jgi:hypothetical protein